MRMAAVLTRDAAAREKQRHDDTHSQALDQDQGLLQ